MWPGRCVGGISGEVDADGACTIQKACDDISDDAGIDRVIPVNRMAISRRGFACGITAAAVLTCPSLSLGTSTTGIRRLRMTNHRAGEMLDIVYWLNGDYIRESLSVIDYFMRDWRENRSIRMDRRNIDNLAATQKLLDSDEPFNLISGYRTARTNHRLASHSNGVASNSLHVSGMAADIQMKGRSVAQIAAAARECNSGGVGVYHGSNFVHIDCGRRRNW